MIGPICQISFHGPKINNLLYIFYVNRPDFVLSFSDFGCHQFMILKNYAIFYIVSRHSVSKNP